MMHSKVLQTLIDSFENLPGIGSKSATRLAYYLLSTPQIYLNDFAQALVSLKENTKLCSRCMLLTETDLCNFCRASGRNHKQVIVVEGPMDIASFAGVSTYNGVFHCLHGALSPIKHIGPNEIYIGKLLERVKNGEVTEIILALNSTHEGEVTANYIANELLKYSDLGLSVSRLGRGVPFGAEIEYMDTETIKRAIESREEL